MKGLGKNMPADTAGLEKTGYQSWLEKLQQQYNRARQGAITQELTEIIAGAEAVD